jgi:general stress protein 26
LQNEPWNRSNLLHFFVPASSPLLAEVADDERVGLGYADLLSGRYVSIGGLASVRRDPPRQAALWNAMARAWFPGGADDPELRLLEVRIETVEYWDMQANRMVPLGFTAGIEETVNGAAGLTTPSYGAQQVMALN